MKTIDFSQYLRDFDYDERKAMKIQLPELLKLYQQGKVQIIDIRFNEEYEAWSVGIGQHIPLNELPDRYNELPKDKEIAVFCPGKIRAGLAYAFLRTKGFENVKVLNASLDDIAALERP